MWSYCINVLKNKQSMHFFENIIDEEKLNTHVPSVISNIHRCSVPASAGLYRYIDSKRPWKPSPFCHFTGTCSFKEEVLLHFKYGLHFNSQRVIAVPSESLPPWRDMSRGVAVQSAGDWEEKEAGLSWCSPIRSRYRQTNTCAHNLTFEPS